MSHTQFVQATAILFVQAATPITLLTVTPSQYTIATVGTHNVLNCTCRRFIVNDDKFNARLSNIALSATLNTAHNAHWFAKEFLTL